MTQYVQAALREIDAALARYGELEASHRQEGSDEWSRWDYLKPPPAFGAEVQSLLEGALIRLHPDGERAVERAFNSFRDPDNSQGSGLRCLAGAVRALRADYQAGRLRRFSDIVRADLFSDFLEMSEQLLDERYKDAAAVIAGGVLEQHHRKLCDKQGVDTTFIDPKGNVVPKKLSVLNAELAKAGAYDKNDQKQVDAWAGLRNEAAHAHYENYTIEQVRLMVQGIRHFLSRTGG